MQTAAIEGMSFWLHENGYLSKVVIEEIAEGAPGAAEIEGRIIALVSRQAASRARRFEFSDLEAATVGGRAFGTLNYALEDEGRRTRILHSYVSTAGLIVQVISQRALRGADPSAAALTEAHHAALEAIELVSRDPEI